MCMSDVSTYTYVQLMHVWCARKLGVGVGSPELELPMAMNHYVGAGNCGLWVLITSPLSVSPPTRQRGLCV